jgi:hypothetical protein
VRSLTSISFLAGGIYSVHALKARDQNGLMSASFGYTKCVRLNPIQVHDEIDLDAENVNFNDQN